MDIIKTIAILAPIFILLIEINDRFSAWRTSRKRRAAQKPITIEQKGCKIAEKHLRQRGLSRKPWVVLLILSICMIYVLPEAMSPDELTRMAVYKIVMGTGIFFFILLQSSISMVVETIYRMKSADLELVKSFLTKKRYD